MNQITEDALKKVMDVLGEEQKYIHACCLLAFDRETICPPDAMEAQGELTAFLGNQAFRLKKDPDFIRAAEILYENREELGECDRILAQSLYRERMQTKNITPEMDHEFSLVMQKAYVDWLRAKEAADYSVFEPSLREVCRVQDEMIKLREDALPDRYDTLLSDYERGMTRETLDRVFNRCKERMIPMLEKIRCSEKTIRSDFMSRTVTDEQQRMLTQKVLTLMDFDFNRGAFSTTEHPFTDGIARDDVRITTHYYPTMFAASLYSVIHECGHALFEQLQPEEDFRHFIQGEKTSGMHESVSRFYENILGRSEEFIHCIYPVIRECMPQVLEDVSERELYEAVNLVEPSLIRTEADEFTYTLHIILRYEIEKMIMDREVALEDLPEVWAGKYEEYLGVRPGNDREGVLQDVHWTGGFGYFPTYALGNMYNAMYYRRMREELDVPALVSAGDFRTINRWMTDHVFASGDRRDPLDWIREITGRDLTPEDFLDYLEEKFAQLYEIDTV